MGARGVLWKFELFTVIGGFATLIHYAVLVILVRSVGVDALVASITGFVVSAGINYLLNRRYTFNSRNPLGETLPRFAVVALLGLGLNTILFWTCHNVLGLHYLIAQVFGTFGAFVSSFTFNLLWTFIDRNSPILLDENPE